MKYKYISNSKTNLYKKALQLAYLLKYAADDPEEGEEITFSGGWSSGGDEDFGESIEYGGSGYSSEEAEDTILAEEELNSANPDSVSSALARLYEDTINPDLKLRLQVLSRAFDMYNTKLYSRPEFGSGAEELWIENLQELTAKISREIDTISDMSYVKNADRENSEWEKNKETYKPFELMAVIKAVIENTNYSLGQWLQDEQSLQDIARGIFLKDQEMVQDIRGKGRGAESLEAKEEKYRAEALDKAKQWKEKYVQLLKAARKQQGLHQKWKIVSQQLEAHRKWWESMKSDPVKLDAYRKRRAKRQKERREYDKRIIDLRFKLRGDLNEEEREDLLNQIKRIEDAKRKEESRAAEEVERLRNIKKTKKEIDPTTGKEVVVTDWSSIDLLGLATHLGQKIASERTQVLDEVKKEFKATPDYITLLKKLGEAESRGIGTIEGVMVELREKLQDLMTTSKSVQSYIDSVVYTAKLRGFQKTLKSLPKLKLEEKARGEVKGISDSDIELVDQLTRQAEDFRKEMTELDKNIRAAGRKSFYTNNQVHILQQTVPYLKSLSNQLKLKKGGEEGRSVDIMEEISDEASRSVDIMQEVSPEQVVQLEQKKMAFRMQRRAFVQEMIGESMPDYLSSDIGSNLKPNIQQILDTMIEEEAGRLLDAMTLAAGGLLEDM